MQAGEPSATAMSTAHARAFHQIVGDPPLFQDRMAVPIVGASAIRSDPFGNGSDDSAVRLRRLYIAARSRFAEDIVAAAVERGTTQVVILGAGLDTAACRNPHPGVRFFEVDHPATQRWKRNRLRETGIPIPGTLTFVPIDFEQTTLETGLAGAGHDSGRESVFVWLGVTPYLSGAAIGTLLRTVARHRDAQLVFDYLYPPAGPGEHDPMRLQRRAARLTAVGEPWLSFFSAEQMAAVLTEIGFGTVDDRSAAELLTAYGVAADASSRTPSPHIVHTRARAVSP